MIVMISYELLCRNHFAQRLVYCKYSINTVIIFNIHFLKKFLSRHSIELNTGLELISRV